MEMEDGFMELKDTDRLQEGDQSYRPNALLNTGLWQMIPDAAIGRPVKVFSCIKQGGILYPVVFRRPIKNDYTGIEMELGFREVQVHEIIEKSDELFTKLWFPVPEDMVGMRITPYIKNRYLIRRAIPTESYTFKESSHKVLLGVLKQANNSWPVSQAIGALEELIESLLKENTALAAWQCPYHDGKEGLVNDEYGNQYCNKDKKLQKYEFHPEPIVVTPQVIMTGGIPVDQYNDAMILLEAKVQCMLSTDIEESVHFNELEKDFINKYVGNSNEPQ